MVIILRLLVGLLIYSAVDWGGAWIAALLYAENKPTEKILAQFMRIYSVLLSLFITFWVVAMGWL